MLQHHGNYVIENTVPALTLFLKFIYLYIYLFIHSFHMQLQY